jgi:hypothetical protein
VAEGATDSEMSGTLFSTKAPASKNNKLLVHQSEVKENIAAVLISP